MTAAEHAPSTTPMDRVAKSERIVVLDVLRGLAILLILVMNIPFMGGYAMVQPFDPRLNGWAPVDQAVWRGIGVFLEGTQRGLLELLFGAGMMIMLRHAMRPDAPVAIADLHFRRNLWLMVFGAFHALVLLWPGDILFPYGLVAIIVFGFRTLSPRAKALLGTAFIVLALAPGAYRYVERADLQAKAAVIEAKVATKAKLTREQTQTLEKWRELKAGYAPTPTAKEREQMAQERKFRLGGLPEYVGFAWVGWSKVNFAPTSWFWLAEIAGTMLLGMALFQWGIIQGRASTGAYLAMVVAGYGLGVGLRWMATGEALRFSPAPQVGWITWDIARLALVFGHVGLVNLLVRSAVGARALSVFQAPGRMPLTIYLSASFIGMWVLFPGFGLAMWGKYSWAGMATIALMVMAAQLVFANLWMRAFESGPVDWLWKSFAYRKRQPFRKAAGPSGAVAAAPAE